MEKLIELLNEYIEKYKPRTNLVKEITDDGYFVNNRNDNDGFLCETIMSKKFGFIKWLVENDKIDQREIEYKFQDALFELEEEEIVKEKSDFLIMLLSISSSPIEDLISYLK